MKLAVLDPLGMVNGLGGVNVTVPVELLESVTVRAASVVIGFPDASCRCTVIVLDATPAVTVTGDVVNTSLFGAPALTVNGALLPAVRLTPLVRVAVRIIPLSAFE